MSAGPARVACRRIGMAALAIGGLAVPAHLVGDRWVASAVLVYSTPWAVLGLLGLVSLVLVPGRWKTGGLVLAGLGLSGAGHSWRHREPSAIPPDAFTVATWNAARILDRRPDQWRLDADLVAIVETGAFDAESWGAFTAAMPGHRWLRLDEGTVVGVRGELLGHENFSQHDRFRCHRVELRCGGRDLRVVVVDIWAQPWRSREEAVRTAFEVAGEGPAIVLGDFNTPPDSIWYKRYSRHYTLANEAQSRGFLETWPWGLPLHALDQIWLSPGLVASDARQQRRASDHRRVEAVVRRVDGSEAK